MVSVDEYGLEFTYGRDLGARDMGLSRSQNKGIWKGVNYQC